MTRPVLQDPLAFAPASRGARASAFFLDYVTTWVVTAAVVAPLLLASDYSDTDGAANDTAATLGIAAAFVIPFLSAALNIVWTHTRGYSVGKRMLGLRVLNIETGTTLSIGRSTVRVLVLFGPVVAGQIIANIVIFIGPLISAVIWAITLGIAKPPYRQTWHDVAAGSIVVTVAPAAVPATTPAHPAETVL